MKKTVLAARFVLGGIYFVFGLNGFFNFIPMNQPMPEGAMAFLGGLMSASYFMPVLKLTEVVCGALLLSGFYVPLALILLAPITLQIFLFHTFLAPAGMIMAVLMVVAHAYLGYSYWSVYRPLFQKK